MVAIGFLSATGGPEAATKQILVLGKTMQLYRFTP